MPIHVSVDDALAACHTCQFADVVGDRDYASVEHLVLHARDTWTSRVNVFGWLEAFAAHPQIGDAAAIKAKFALNSSQADRAFGARSETEQQAALASGGGDGSVFAELAALNEKYRKKFGHIFIVCASGRSAPEILAELKRRIECTPLEELRAAAEEQMAITELRLRALASSSSSSSSLPPSSSSSRAAARTEQLGRQLAPPVTATPAPAGKSPLTTHVLDTTLGLPARDMAIELHVLRGGGGRGAATGAPLAPSLPADAGTWVRLAAARTDSDGRVGTLLPAGSALEPGCTYRVRFGTGEYLEALSRRFYGSQGGGGGGTAAAAATTMPLALSPPSVPPFYPRADVEFTVPLDPQARRAHYHIPLLLSPFGFSTYRGS